MTCFEGMNVRSRYMQTTDKFLKPPLSKPKKKAAIDRIKKLFAIIELLMIYLFVVSNIP
jgi:hypothetical protein